MLKTYEMTIANDNGNNEHKLIINNEKVRQPNIYVRTVSAKIEKNNSIEQAVNGLHQNIDVTINSPGIKEAPNTRFWIGQAAMMGVEAGSVKNMDLSKGEKHLQDLPIINTLGVIATKTVQMHYQETKDLQDNDVLEVNVNMSTCLPASVYTDEAAQQFKNRFQKGTHLVTVHIKSDLKLLVKVNFEYVGVSAEGVPPLYEIIEDGKGNYRSGEMFEEFTKEYNLNDIDGSYFADKNLLHVDIGDGTTELILTHGYESKHTEGKDIGLGKALEDVAKIWKTKKKKWKRQDISDIIKSEEHPFKEDVLVDLKGAPLVNLAGDIATEVENFFDKMRANQVHVMVVYGGGSILLKDNLYPKLKELADNERFKLLWIPTKYAVDMNVDGLNSFNNIYMNELVAATKED